MFWHKHRWQVRGAQQLLRNYSHSEVKTPVTEVLRVCECGEVSTVTLDGWWTLDQLQLKLAAKDAEFLHNLGVKP